MAIVHGVDFRVVDQRVGVGRPFGHAVTPGVILRLGRVSPHDHDQGAARGLLEAGAALDLGNFAATDNAPTNGQNRYTSILVPSTSRNFRIHSGCPGQAAAVTRLPSTTALENVSLTSRQTAPDLTRSGLTAGYAVQRRPVTTPAATRICCPWQMDASGLPAWAKWRTIWSTRSSRRRYSGRDRRG